MTATDPSNLVQPQTRQHWQVPWIGAIAAVLLLASPFLYYHANRVAHNPDSFLYAEFAKQMLAGGRIYSEVWADKPPLTLFAYVLPQLFAPRSYEAISIFGGICIAASAIMLAWPFRSLSPVALSCAVFMVLFPLAYWDFAWFSTEHIANLFITPTLILTYFMFRDQQFRLVQCLIAGALVCAAFHVRQNTLLIGLVPAVGILWTGHSPSRKAVGLVMVVVGGLIAWALILASVIWVGDLSQYFYMVFRYPGKYASIGEFRQFGLLLAVGSQTSIFLLLLLFAGLAFRDRYRPLVIVCVLAGLASCLLPLRHFGHYWVTFFPYLGLLIAVGTYQSARLMTSLKWVCLAVVCAAVLAHSIPTLYGSVTNPTAEHFREIADHADRVAPPNAKLLVWGPMTSEAIQFASRMPPAFTVFTLFVLTPPVCDILPWSKDRIIEEYMTHPPDVMVLWQDYFAPQQQSPEQDNARQLVNALLNRYPYERKASVKGFVIVVRKPN